MSDKAITSAAPAAPAYGRSLALLALAAALIALPFIVKALGQPALVPLAEAASLSPALVLAAQVLALLGTSVATFRVWLVATYRPCPDVPDALLPTLTVIVPAFNEGRQVLSTLRSLAASHYPMDRLQLVAVDDGSSDDTWLWIRRGAKELGPLVTAVRCPQNGGKRRALEEGFRRATGDIWVTVDSDSEVLPDTLRRMVAPFIRDPLCGAVAGNVRVLNRHAGPLPKMLDAAFTTAFDFIRAAESQVGAVMCTPGALSAYRADLVRTVLDEWLSQTFMGRPATIGEDRAMTNLILRAGATVRYQSDAVVLTQVPTRAPQLCRMFLRWARSNLRESLVLSRFVLRVRTVDGAPRRGLQLLFGWSVLRTLLSALTFVPAVAALLLHPQAVVVLVPAGLLAAVPMAAITCATRGLRVGLWALPWGAYSLFVTGWIGFWALCTLQQGGWLTRGHGAQAPSALPHRAPPLPFVYQAVPVSVRPEQRERVG